MEHKQFTITKRIAKHGKQAIIVIPKILSNELKPETIVKLNIEVIQEASENGSHNN
jgi:hypothetical protein